MCNVQYRSLRFRPYGSNQLIETACVPTMEKWIILIGRLIDCGILGIVFVTYLCVLFTESFTDLFLVHTRYFGLCVMLINAGIFGSQRAFILIVSVL